MEILWHNENPGSVDWDLLKHIIHNELSRWTKIVYKLDIGYIINSIIGKSRRGLFATAINWRKRVSDLPRTWIEMDVNWIGHLARADLLKPGKIKRLSSFPFWWSWNYLLFMNSHIFNRDRLSGFFYCPKCHLWLTKLWKC